MVNATINGYQDQKTGNFNLTVNFDVAIRDFTSVNVQLAAVSGNGNTNVTFQPTGSGDSYNLGFILPEDVEGSFTVRLIGMVTRVGGSSPEGIMATAVTVTYDNRSSIAARFGELRYADNGNIGLPIIFMEDVLYFHKTDCEIKHIFGNALYDMEYFLTGSDSRTFELTFIPPAGRRGVFSVDINGYVFKTATSIRDNVVITPKLVPYNSYKPVITKYIVPDALTVGVWDIWFETDIPAIGVGIDDFIGEGPNVGTPVLYRACSLDVEPKLPEAPSDPAYNAAVIGDWVLDTTGNSRVQAKYFVLRWNVPESLKGRRYSVSHREGSFRAPVPGG